MAPKALREHLGRGVGEKRLVALLLAGLAAAAGAAADGPRAAQPLTLSQAFEIALAANAGLSAVRLQADIARGQVAVARQRPNPELLLEEVRETPKDAASLSQTLELGGKRSRRIELASAGVESRDAESARAVVDLHNRVRRAFFALRTSERRLTEAEALRTLAQRTRDTANARFESGGVPRLDTLQAELALAQAENDVETAAGQRASAQAQLNVLLARPPETPTATSGPEEPPAAPDPAAAVQIARQESRELGVLDRALDEQRARIAWARAEQTPSPTLQGGVTRRGEPEFAWGWRLGLSIPLPLFTFHGAAVQVERLTLAQLEAARRARAGEIAGAVRAAAAIVVVQRAQLRRFREQIQPQAEEIEGMAEDSYRSGQTGLPALLQALQATRDVRLRAIQADSDYEMAVADLEGAMGVSLP